MSYDLSKLSGASISWLLAQGRIAAAEVAAERQRRHAAQRRVLGEFAVHVEQMSMAELFEATSIGRLTEAQRSAELIRRRDLAAPRTWRAFLPKVSP